MTRTVFRSYPRVGFTGGFDGDLDWFDGNDLAEKDMAFVIDDGYFAPYFCDLTSGLPEDSPKVIVPDDNPGAINWLLQHGLFNGLTTYLDPTAGIQIGNRDYNDLRYLMQDGSKALSGDMSAGGFSITNHAQNITDNAILTVDSTTVAAGEYAKLTANGVESKTFAEVRSDINVEDGADVTDTANVDAAGAVMETDYGIQTVLASILDNTPTAIAFAASTIMGRTAAGNVAALTIAEVITLLNSSTGLNAGILTAGDLLLDRLTGSTFDPVDHTGLGTNANDMRNNATAYYGRSANNPNFPVTYGILYVFNNYPGDSGDGSAYILQFCTSHPTNDIYVRNSGGDGNTWSAWVRLLRSDEPDAAATADTIALRAGDGSLYMRYPYCEYVNMSHGVTTRNSDTVFYSSTDDFIRKNNKAGMLSSLSLVIGTDVLAQQAIGILNDNLVEIDSTTVASGEYAKFTLNGLESKSFAEVRSDINVEDGADVTDTANVDAAGATMNSDTDLSLNNYFLDEDDMSSNDATKASSQQSIKAYVDSVAAGGFPTGTEMYFYQSTAPTDWTINTTPADAVLAVKGGTGAYNVSGGVQAGTWTQPNHTHTGPSHNHRWSYFSGRQYLYNSGGGAVAVTCVASANTRVACQTGTAVSNNAYMSNAGTGATGGGATAATWRPLAQVGIICTKD